MTQSLNLSSQKGIHGKYSKSEQRRAQENETGSTQEAQGAKAAQAAGLSAWIEEAEAQEDGPRPSEAVKAALGI